MTHLLYFGMLKAWCFKMNGNDFISWILRSPLHGMLSHGMLLISVVGCKTGRQYTTPVEYYCDGGYLWVVTNRNRTWWRNLRGGAEVSLLLKRKAVRAFAELEMDTIAVESQMDIYIKHIPQAARSLGIHMKNGNANGEDIARIAKDRLFVRLRLISA